MFFSVCNKIDYIKSDEPSDTSIAINPMSMAVVMSFCTFAVPVSTASPSDLYLHRYSHVIKITIKMNVYEEISGCVSVN